jgi:hypothetical protein
MSQYSITIAAFAERTTRRRSSWMRRLIVCKASA